MPLSSCLDSVSLKYKGEQERVKPCVCLRQSEQGSSVGEVSGPGPKLQSCLA